MDTNRACVVRRTGGPEQLEIVELPVPIAGPGKLLIRVEATGIAFADVIMRMGVYPGVKVPFTPGYEVVGTVVSGEGFAPGTRVAALTVTGGAGRFAVVPATDCVAVPAGIGSAEAAALVLNGITAYQMLTRCVARSSVERMLVWGAAGGVGSILLALGKHFGIETLGVASGGRRAFVEAHGATPIDRGGNVAAQVQALGGVDAVFDGVGGPNVKISEASIRGGGATVLFGFQGALGGGGAFNPVRAGIAMLTSPRRSAQAQFATGQGLRAYLITQWKETHPGFYRNDLAELLRLAAEGAIAPAIAARLPLDRIADGHRMIGEGTQLGKIVIEPWA